MFILGHSEKVRGRYVDGLRAKFPDLDVHSVDHWSRASDCIGSTDVVLTFCGMLSDEVVRVAHRLKWIQVLGTGTDGVVDLPSLRPNVIVTRVRGIHGAAMSEAALSAMLSLSRNLPRALRNQQRHLWERWPSTLLAGKTVGILGMGAIAEALAPRCKALGMTVLGVSASQRPAAGFDRVCLRSDLHAVVGEFDYLVVLVPLSAATRRIIDARLIAAMKPTSYLINLARGGIVDERALAAALEEESIAGASLDVFDEEPLPTTSPLWSTKNLIVTPHLGGMHDRYVDDVLPIVEANMRCFLTGAFEQMNGLVERNS